MNRLFRVLIFIIITLTFSCKALWKLVSSDGSKNLISLKDLNSYLVGHPSLDTIYIENGEYNNIEIEVKNKNGLVILPESVGKVRILGNSTLSFIHSKNISFSGFEFYNIKNRSAIQIDQSSFIRIHNNLFDRCGAFQFGKIVRITNGSSNNKIFNNTFDYLRSLGVVVDVYGNADDSLLCLNNEIFNNLFINTPNVKTIHPNSNGNGFEAIQLGQGSPKAMEKEIQTQVYHNLFQSVTGDRSEIISVKSSSNLIQENIFLNNDSGITFRVGNFNVFSSNIVYQTRAGIRVFGKGHRIENNYFEGGEIAISIPAANRENVNVDATEGSFYFQAEDLDIQNNWIVSPSITGISIGSKLSDKRNYLPKNLRINGNELVISGKATALQSSGVGGLSNFKEQNNQFRINSEDAGLKLKIDSIQGVIRSALKYEINHTKIGINWARTVE